MLKKKRPLKRFAKLRSLLRGAWIRDEERGAAMKLGRRLYEGPNKRQKYEHQCIACLEWFKATEIQIDHIVPCGTFLCDEDWATFGPKLFCSRYALQKLCKPCHKLKTKAERSNAQK